MRLFLLRHAKTEINSISGLDFDRRLKKKGLDQIHIQSNFFKENYNGTKFSLHVSTAKRAQQTYFGSKQALTIEKELHTKALYLPSLNSILSYIWSLDNKYKNVMIIAHNNGVSDCLRYFTDTQSTIPTCGLAVIEFDTDNWMEVSKSTGSLIDYHYPVLPA